MFSIRIYNEKYYNYWLKKIANNLEINQLNGAWASVNVSAAKHVAYWVIATDDQTSPVALIMGQREDTTLSQARMNNIFSGLSLSGLPVQELVLIARLIIKETGSGVFYTLEEVLDLRGTNIGGNITSPLITDHGGLGGLNDSGDHMWAMLGTGASTDNTLPRFDGTDGRTMQTSGVVIDDSDNVTGIVTLTATDLVANDDVTVGENVVHQGDADTMIAFADNQIDLKVGGNTAITAIDSMGAAAVGFFGRTSVQAGLILAADGTLADITTKFNTLLINLGEYGLLIDK